MRTYKGHTYLGPIITLDDLRTAHDQLAGLPGDTPILRAEDDGNEPDSYAFIGEIEIAWWDGEVQCDENTENARKAVFI